MQQLTIIAKSIIAFINTVAVPLLFAVAFIVFLFGVFRFFILGGANEEKRREGRQMIIYSVVGFAIMIVLWGLVNLVVNSFDIKDKSMPPLPTFGTSGASNSGTTPQPATTGSAAPTTSTDCRVVGCKFGATCDTATGSCTFSQGTL